VCRSKLKIDNKDGQNNKDGQLNNKDGQSVDGGS
jgi:hypothetical protein